MGSFIENKIVDFIKKTNSNISEEEECILRYGIQIYYFNISKLVIIMSISVILNVFWKACTATLLIFVLRRYTFGFHADSFWTCLIVTGVNIFGIVYLSALKFHLILKFLAAVISLLVFYVYAPADTEEMPLVNYKTRKKLKLKTMIVSCLYCILAFSISEPLSGMIILSLLVVGFNTCPIPYILFRKGFKNYEKYI